MCECYKELEMFTLAVANCGKAVRIYERGMPIGEVVKDEAHFYLTVNDFALAAQVYKSIKDLEECRYKKRIQHIIETTKELQAVA